MGYNFKEVMNKPERFAPGHRMCAGCGATICARNVLRGLHEGDKAVIVQQDVLMFHLSSIHTLHGKTVIFIVHLKMPAQQWQVLKGLTRL